MPRRSFSGEKRRRQLEKSRKQEQKRQRRQNKDDQPNQEPNDAYLEYLNPGGPVDKRFEPVEEESDEESDADASNDETGSSDSKS